MAEETPITPETVDALAEKLGRLTEQLSDQEHHVLTWILTRAAAASEQDVCGYLGVSPGVPALEIPVPPPGSLAAQLRLAAGLGAGRSDASVIIGRSDAASWITTKQPSLPG